MYINAAHILVETLEQAKALKTRVDAGENFSMLARAHSKCPSASTGGNLGFFSRGQMVKPFEDAAFSAEVGKVTDPVQTQFGFHLIQRLY